MGTNNFSDQDNHRKVLALIVCLFMGFIYIETIWKPYFEGQKQPQNAARQQNLEISESSPVATSSPEMEQYKGSEEQGESQGGLKNKASEQSASAPKGDYPSDAELAESGDLLVVTEAFRLKLSLLGGRIEELRLNDYLADLKDPEERLNLIHRAEYRPLPLGVYSGSIDDSRTKYEVVSGLSGGARTLEVDDGAGSTSLVLKGLLPDGRTLTKELIFQPQGYLFDAVVRISQANEDENLAVELTRNLVEGEGKSGYRYSGPEFAWFDGEDTTREQFSKMQKDSLSLGNVVWAELSDKYFMATLLSREQLLPAEALRTDKFFRLRMIGTGGEIKTSLFFGPKRYRMLEKIGFDLERSISFGWFGILAAPLLLLLHWFYGVFGNYGLAIVSLTILVRFALYPLNSASFRQMKAMQDIKPEMDRIRDQVKDKQEQQMQMMALYKKRGVNPLGGCFPMLIQMPVFIGLYSALGLAVELRHAPYALWINDLSAPEQFMVGGVRIPVLVILFVLSMMVQQWITPSTVDPKQKKIMMVMPIVMGFFFMNFPAGLSLYWLTNNLISISQQQAMRRADASARSSLMVTFGVSAVVFTLAFIVTFI